MIYLSQTKYIINYASPIYDPTNTEKMKWTITTLIATLAASASVTAFDLTVFGARAIKNLNQTPTCAQLCIFNPKWARTYAPECADIPLGVEYATKLCENYMYQHMLDSCFKDKCSDGDRQKVFHAPLQC
jgi:hypothetical protein